MWHQKLAPAVARGRVTVIGVVQEQHPERARLYRQWRQLGWKIAVDSLNLLDLKVVPVPIAVDESGVVRGLGRSFDLDAFLSRRAGEIGGGEAPPPAAPDLDALARSAEEENDAPSWRRLGDACFHEGRVDRAIDAYGRALETDPSDARAHFRRGVTLHRRAESQRAGPDDAQRAVDHWTSALALDPNQYIWRRRLQQYGPRLAKPYNFYEWVGQARAEISARGQSPVPLPVEPSGSELLTRGDEASPPLRDPDPEGKIQRDRSGGFRIQTMVTPRPARPGTRVRVRVTLKPSPGAAYWNNEGEPLTLTPRLPDGFTLADGTLSFEASTREPSEEDRSLEFELAIPTEATPGQQAIPAYVLYEICERETGVCRQLRQDLELKITIDRDAPRLR